MAESKQEPHECPDCGQVVLIPKYTGGKLTAWDCYTCDCMWVKLLNKQVKVHAK